MTARSLTGFALMLFGIGIAVSTILGPLVLGVIEFRVSESAENQLVGGEVVSLFVAAPLAVLAGVLWLRGHRLAPVLAMAPALYAVYTYFQFILGPEYERYPGNNEKAFPLYAALILMGWLLAVRAWSALGDQPLPQLSAALRRGLAVVLIILGIFFALTWISSIAEVLGGDLSDEYLEHPALFWMVRLMDLTFIIPVAVITGVGLLRRVPGAVRLAYAFVGFQTLLIGAVAGMAAVMVIRDDPAASRQLLVVMALLTLVLAALFGLLVRALLDRRQPASDAREPSLAGPAPHLSDR